MLLWSFLGFLALLWLAKLQSDRLRQERDRHERQQRHRVGLEPIRGTERGNAAADLDAEERRLLALLRERQDKTGSDT